MILITHPDLPEAPPASVSEKAFERLWEPKGWKRVDTDQEPEAPAVVTTSARVSTTPPSVTSTSSGTATSGQED